MLYLIHSNFLYVTCCLLHCSPYLYLPSARNAVGRRRVSEIRATCTANSRRVQSKFSTHTIRPDMHRKPAPRPVGARLTSSESEPTMGPRASSPVTHSTHGVISLPTPPPPPPPPLPQKAELLKFFKKNFGGGWGWRCYSE